ncbi:MAG: Ribosomal large subunit methyltransferase [Bacteriovoracaceae bacterium]|nr:Ribosomal large subunit methyltransferase [Bacteriovoracaceae bacterium]
MIRVSSFGKFENTWRDQYIQQIKRLTPFEWIQIPLKKSPDQRPTQLLLEEAKFLKENSNFYILDALGKEMNSDEFYKWCFKESRHLVVGPAIGFHPDFKAKSQGSLSLSRLTFTHALAQTILAESIFRSACILKNHPFVK